MVLYAFIDSCVVFRSLRSEPFSRSKNVPYAQTNFDVSLVFETLVLIENWMYFKLGFCSDQSEYFGCEIVLRCPQNGLKFVKNANFFRGSAPEPRRGSAPGPRRGFAPGPHWGGSERPPKPPSSV